MEIEASEGESVYDLLLRNNIPPTSVITFMDGKPVSEYHRISDGHDYNVKLIEGYDINSIRGIYEKQQAEDSYVKSILLLQKDGSLDRRDKQMTLDELEAYVQTTISSTIRDYNLIEPGSRVVIGLSGGVDSSALLLALNGIKRELNFDIVCATFEDFDIDKSKAYSNARSLTDRLSVQHELIGSSSIDNIFNLTKPLREILPELMQTEYRHITMYIDHHTTRRALEYFAQSMGIDTVALGLHTTDLMAGLLNSFLTGYYISGMPRRNIKDYTYIYPLSYITKKELHLYYYAKTSEFAVHSSPNAWEVMPMDRNFYYYLSDYFQTLFPGIENYLFEAHTNRLMRQPPLKYTQCGNCSSHILQQIFSPANEELCDVCGIFKAKNYLK